MRIVTESQPVSKPSYVHLAYVSAETAATFLLSAGIILGIVILIQAALSAWQKRASKGTVTEIATNDQPDPRKPAVTSAKSDKP